MITNLGDNDEIAEPEQSPMVINNRNLEIILREEEQQKTPLPDVNQLRDKLRETPTPTPVGVEFNYELKPRERTPFTRLRKNLAVAVLDYRLVAFNMSLELRSADNEDAPPIRVLKNSDSKEKFTVEPGQYELFADFILRRSPGRKINAYLGTYKFHSGRAYEFRFRRDLEQSLLYQLEVRELDRKKRQTRSRGFRSP